MEWVFTALALAVVTAVAMVAVGRLGGLAPAVPDRPDVRVPAGRPLGAADLREVQFSVAVRGYRMDEVDALLARLAEEMTARDALRESTTGASRSVADRGTPPAQTRSDVASSGTDRDVTPSGSHRAESR